MKLRNTEWPKLITLLTCFAASSYIEGAQAKSTKSLQNDWKVLCTECSLERCPTLEIFPRPLRRGLLLLDGRTTCSYLKWEDGSKERECFSVEVWRNASPDTLDHEMAHVLQWLGGDNEGRHGPDFRRAYERITGRSPGR